MPTQSRNNNTYPDLPISFVKWADMAETIEALAVPESQLKGFEYGKLVVLDSLAFSVYCPKTNHKHPNRPMKPAKNQLEGKKFDHLKKGWIYKASVSGTARLLFKTPCMVMENKIGIVQTGAMVVYLETVCTDVGWFHKLIVDDCVGYVYCYYNGFRLKRITSRMLRRMEAKNEKQAPQP